MRLDAINAIQIILIYHVTPVRTVHFIQNQSKYYLDISTLEADSQNISMFDYDGERMKNTTTLHTGTINQNVKRDIYPATNKTISIIK
jgi:hypothetical protein